jgi:hypothetical protein
VSPSAGSGAQIAHAVWASDRDLALFANIERELAIRRPRFTHCRGPRRGAQRDELTRDIRSPDPGLRVLAFRWLDAVLPPRGRS